MPSMKRLLIVLTVSLFAVHTMAQKTTDSTAASATVKPKKKFGSFVLGDHANDHLLIQLGYSDFLSKKDSVSTKAFGRSFNMYFMMAFNSLSDPHFSVAVGLGFGSDNYYLNKERIDLTNPTRGVFYADTADNYRRSKLTMSYIELPAEIRYASNPTNLNHSWKFALGIKAGLLTSSQTKVKMLRDINGLTDYTTKVRDKHLFTPGRLVGQFRVGYGVFSLFGQADITNFFRSGDGPSIRPWTAGVTISGL